MKITDLIMEFLRDAKSRKFLAMVFYFWLVIVSSTELCLPGIGCFGPLGISDTGLMYVMIVILGFTIMEGIADTVSRRVGEGK